MGLGGSGVGLECGGMWWGGVGWVGVVLGCGGMRWNSMRWGWGDAGRWWRGVGWDEVGWEDAVEWGGRESDVGQVGRE